MANTNAWDFLGAYKDDFMKSSLHVFCNLKGTMQYVGKTDNTKTLNPNTEMIEWYDNTGGVQTLYALDIDKVNLAMDFSFMQVGDPNVLALALNGRLDTSDPNKTYIFFGSNPQQLAEAEWRFVGQTTDKRVFTVVVRRGIVVPTGSYAFGTPGQYTMIPVTLRALQNTAITDTERDLAYLMIDKRSFS